MCKYAYIVGILCHISLLINSFVNLLKSPVGSLPWEMTDGGCDFSVVYSLSLSHSLSLSLSLSLGWRTSEQTVS